jgi:hypothetical protein
MLATLPLLQLQAACLPLPASAFNCSRASSLASFISTSSPFERLLTFSRSFLRDNSSILMCLLRASCVGFDFFASPSSIAIRDFISPLSISQAFRSRSCLCHSVCKKRITPVDLLAFQSRHPSSIASNLAVYMALNSPSPAPTLPPSSPATT